MLLGQKNEGKLIKSVGQYVQYYTILVVVYYTVQYVHCTVCKEKQDM